MNEDYIAGFFDGEGSAMVITVKRTMKSGAIFRFRPVIRIAQNNREVLDEMKDFLSFGHVTKSSNDCHLYVVNGLDNVLLFIEKITNHCHLKTDVLLKVKELALFQKNASKRNKPYTLNETLKMLDLRDQVFALNQKTRSNMVQKYPKEIVISETTFYTDEEWIKFRSEEGRQNMEKRYSMEYELEVK